MDKRVFRLAILTIISAFILVMLIVYATNAKRINELIDDARGEKAATSVTSGEEAPDSQASAGDGATTYGEQIGDNLSGFLADDEFFDETEQVSSLVVIRRNASGGTDSVSDYVKEPGSAAGSDGNGAGAGSGDGISGTGVGSAATPEGAGGTAVGSVGADGTTVGVDGATGTMVGTDGVNGTAVGSDGATGTMVGTGGAEAASEGAGADGTQAGGTAVGSVGAGGTAVGTGGSAVGSGGTAVGTGGDAGGTSVGTAGAVGGTGISTDNPDASGDASSQMRGTGMAIVGQLINPNPEGTTVTDSAPEGVANAGAQNGAANAGSQGNSTTVQGTSPDSSGYLTTVPDAPPGGFGEYIPVDQTIGGTPVGN
jgi:hypothetical protein